jgi:twitching motility protein PilT
MKWIISQRLLPQVGGGRVAALEVLGNSLRVQEAIIHGESDGKTFYEMMEQSEPFGWITFDSSITRLYEQGKITEQTAVAYASRRALVKRRMDQIKAGRGEKTTDIRGLKMDREYRLEPGF